MMFIKLSIEIDFKAAAAAALWQQQIRFSNDF